MSALRLEQAKFLLSAAELPQLPEDTGFEVAFVGRSNAGKSSALNLLLNNKKMARVSKTPGRTQLINVFCIDDHRRLVDLPGYGFAKVNIKLKAQWSTLIDNYLHQRECLQGLILLMDIRHPMKPQDEQLIEWCQYQKIPLHILLTKADKLSYGAKKNTFLSVKRIFEDDPLIHVQLFSSVSKEGLDEAKAKVHAWLDMKPPLKSMT